MIFEKENVRFHILDVFRHDRHGFSLTHVLRKTPAISFRQSGKGYFECRGQKLPYEEKSVLFVPADVEYNQYSDRENVIAVILEVPNYNGTELEFLQPLDKTVEFYFEELYRIWTQKKRGYYYEATGMMNQIFAKLYLQATASPKHAQYKKIQPSVEYLLEHFTSPCLSVPEIAAVSHMSEVYFRRLFQAEMGTSPRKMIAKLRLERAKLLLEHGYAVKEVALLTGFNACSYFSDFFKKQTGMSPDSYKNVHRLHTK